MARQLTRSAKLLIILGVFRTISELFFQTFLVAFLMHISTNEIIAVSTYNLFFYATTALFFVLLAGYCKRGNTTKLFAFNILPKVALLALIITIGDRLGQYIIPLGVLYGIGTAVYYLPKNILVGTHVTNDMTTKYVGLETAVYYAVKLITPIVLGALITLGSYIEIAWVILGLTLIESVFIYQMVRTPHHDTPLGQRTDFQGFLRCVLQSPLICSQIWVEMLRGASTAGPMSVVITMYTVYIFHTDLNLGVLTTIFALCSIATCFVFSRYIKQSHFPIILKICIPVILAIMTCFITDTTPLTFIIYNFTYATIIQILQQIFTTNIYSVSKSKCYDTSHNIEYFVVRDVALFIGRWAAFVVLIYIGVFGDVSMLRYYLGLITGLMLLAGILSAKVSKYTK